jgi:hypothetical protein
MMVEDIKVFIPSKDFEASSAFYTDMGFSSQVVTRDISLFENGECAFFLQRFYKQQLAENLMLQLCVLDIESAFKKAESSRNKRKITPIQQESWGQVFYVWGPSGELWHVTQRV